jgi:small neutral amino acid transporter SnatA (MarC family)
MMFGPAEIFTFLFVMLGPLKLLGPFVQRTRGLDDATVRQIAFWAFVIATAGIVAGGLIGRAVLAKWHVSIPALQITAASCFSLLPSATCSSRTSRLMRLHPSRYRRHCLQPRCGWSFRWC